MRRTPNRHIHAGLFAAGVIWLIALAVAPAVLDERQTDGDAASARAPLASASGTAGTSAPNEAGPAPGETGHEPLSAPAGQAEDIDATDASAGASGSTPETTETNGAGGGSVVATGWAPGAFHGSGGGSSSSTAATGGGAPSVGGSGGAGIAGPVGGGASAPGGPSGLPSAGSPGGPGGSGGGSGGSSGTPTQTDAGQGGGPTPGSSTPPAPSTPGGASGGGGTPTQTATGPAPSTTPTNSGPGDAGGTPPPSDVISGTDPVDGDLIIGPGQTHSPGNSPGQQTVSGDYVLDGIFEAELGGTEAGTEYDQIVADGAAILNGTIDVRLIDDFMPETADIFDIIIASSFSFGDDFQIFFPDLTDGLFLDYTLFDLDDERTAFRLTAQEGPIQTASTDDYPGITQTTQIPEPSTLLVLSLGIALAVAGLAAVRRRPAF